MPPMLLACRRLCVLFKNGLLSILFGPDEKWLSCTSHVPILLLKCTLWLHFQCFCVPVLKV